MVAYGMTIVDVLNKNKPKVFFSGLQSVCFNRVSCMILFIFSTKSSYSYLAGRSAKMILEAALEYFQEKVFF